VARNSEALTLELLGRPEDALGVFHVCGHAASEQVRLKGGPVAVNSLEVSQRPGLEVVPPGDERLRWRLPGQERSQVLVALHGLTGRL
jgi:hypothetical protein